VLIAPTAPLADALAVETPPSRRGFAGALRRALLAAESGVAAGAAALLAAGLGSHLVFRPFG